MLNHLSEILGARWLIYGGEIPKYFPLFISFLNGNRFSASDFESDTQLQKPYTIQSGQGSLVNQSCLSDHNIPQNSVAVIPIKGTMVSWKTIELINNIHMAEANPKINSILFLVNSPGGMVFMTDIAAKAIADSPLPSVAFVMQMAASAAMWLTSACDLILVSSQMDLLGSVGTFLSYTDFTTLMKEKLGVTVHELYASASSRKNEEIRAMLEGNSQPMLEQLDFVNNIFHQAIRQNLKIAADSEVFTGAIFHAEKAIQLGLANQITTIEDAANRAFHLGNINQFIKNQ